MDITTLEEDKQKIIVLFNTNVRGKSPPVRGLSGHDGYAGHWLETSMGIRHNGNNAPDLHGFEMKNDTLGVTTFGDWSPDSALFKRDKKNPNPNFLTKPQFTTIFGHPNPEKNGRHSWSGKPCPKVNRFNDYGQKLIVTETHDILAIYCFSEDKRPDKASIVPINFQIEELVLCKWTQESISKKLEKKFNNNGWFKCLMKDNIYTEIAFAPPMTFTSWIEAVKSGDVYFDSGMYETNFRNYSHWRAGNKFWNNLITERY